jgi:hypothetical protein
MYKDFTYVTPNNSKSQHNLLKPGGWGFQFIYIFKICMHPDQLWGPPSFLSNDPKDTAGSFLMVKIFGV